MAFPEVSKAHALLNVIVKSMKDPFVGVLFAMKFELE